MNPCCVICHDVRCHHTLLVTFCIGDSRGMSDTLEVESYDLFDEYMQRPPLIDNIYKLADNIESWLVHAKLAVSATTPEVRSLELIRGLSRKALNYALAVGFQASDDLEKVCAQLECIFSIRLERTSMMRLLEIRVSKCASLKALEQKIEEETAAHLQGRRDMNKRDFELLVFINSLPKGIGDVYRSRYNQNLKDAVDYYPSARSLAYSLSRIEDEQAIYIERPRGFSRIIVPSGFEQLVLVDLHEHLGHVSFQEMRYEVRKRYWWPRLGKDIREFCLKCPQCRHVTRRQRKEPPQPAPVEEKPFGVTDQCEYSIGDLLQKIETKAASSGSKLEPKQCETVYKVVHVISPSMYAVRNIVDESVVEIVESHMVQPYTWRKILAVL